MSRTSHQIAKRPIEHSFLFDCDCGRAIRVKRKNMGIDLLCPDCGQKHQVPEYREHEHQVYASPARNAEPKSELFQTPRRRWSLAPVSLCLGLVLIAVSVIGSWILATMTQQLIVNFGISLWTLLLIAVGLIVLFVMGVTYVFKGCFGDLIELD